MEKLFNCVQPTAYGVRRNIHSVIVIALVLLLAFLFFVESPFVHAQVFDAERYHVFEGKLVVTDYISFKVPIASVTTRHSSSGWGGAKAKFLIDEETYAKKGDLLVEFDFPQQDILDDCYKYKAEAESRKIVSLGEIKEELNALKVSLEKKKLDVNKLELEQKKQGIISSRDFKLLQADYEIAKFEVSTLEKKVKEKEKIYKAEAIYYNADIKAWNGYVKSVTDIKKLYKRYAPADGFVSYPRLKRRKIKATVGKWMSTGSEFMRLSTSKKMKMEFYLPEKLLRALKIGQVVKAEVVGKDIYFNAKVNDIELSPIMAGAIDDDFEEVSAIMKVILVRADIIDNIEFMPGSELKVNVEKIKLASDG
ncbi:MAG: hypothetical protein ABIA04_12575 [Pseudomonadota bacterium]